MIDQSDEQCQWATRDRTKPEPATRTFARRMRAQPTEAERKLWWHLRHRLELAGSHFRRQVRIGSYIVDFANHQARVVVEVDGGQHATTAEEDARRTAFLESEGYRVLRFWNNDVLSSIDAVLEIIAGALSAATPTPDPSPQGVGESIRRDKVSRG